ncbi:putative apyrase 6 isoform X2 [Iris pallida]|uniref:Apyrase 6 isoform X2 n=1 Tax=Iris pallida TaxID=29817 RepID=A0AAX6HPS3_IRIPA|nr:putative apyrase 6 isoform X2 [Iris pallida]
MKTFHSLADLLPLQIRTRSPKPASRHKPLLLLLPASLLFLLIFFLLRTSSSPEPSFGVVIDAGSTGTRIHVFTIRPTPYPNLSPFVVDPVAEMKVRPGLSSYAGDPGRAAESVAELVEFARGKVPGEVRSGTEVRLMATAGLRMLEDNVAREKILEGCRKVLRGSGFRFRDEWAAVISGRDEGIFAWVAANYALGTLGGDPLETTGIIELGGASAQVTFASSEPMPPEFLRVLNFGENTYSLYSNSFLHFGQNAAYHSVQELLSSRVLKSCKSSNAIPGLAEFAKFNLACVKKIYISNLWLYQKFI